MSKNLKKSMIMILAFWFATMIMLLTITIIANDQGTFKNPTEQQYDNLISHAEKIKDGILENKDIRNIFLSKDMSNIVTDVSQGDISSVVEITSEKIIITCEQENAILKKTYKVFREDVEEKNGTFSGGIILIEEDTVKSENNTARKWLIGAFIITNALIILAIADVIYTEKKS